MFTLTVSFPNSMKEYHYMSSVTAEAGAFAVVDTPSNGLVIVEVHECSDGVLPQATKRIVQLVDTTEYEAFKDEQAVKKVAKRKLDAMLQQVEETAKYKVLLGEFPEAFALIQALEA